VEVECKIVTQSYTYHIKAYNIENIAAPLTWFPCPSLLIWSLLFINYDLHSHLPKKSSIFLNLQPIHKKIYFQKTNKKIKIKKMWHQIFFKDFSNFNFRKKRKKERWKKGKKRGKPILLSHSSSWAQQLNISSTTFFLIEKLVIWF